MQEQIAILLNKFGELADLGDVVKINIIQENDMKSPVIELPVLNTMNTPNSLRDFSETLCQHLGDCHMILGRLMTGIFYQTMVKKGYTLLEADTYSEDLLEQIFIDQKKRITREQEELQTVPRNPEPIDLQGNYYLNFYQLQKKHPEISSKKALLPFLNNELFTSLTLICSHEIPWLLPYCEDHNLSYKAKREEGLYQVIIAHKMCDEIDTLTTKYGRLIGCGIQNYYPNHQIKEVTITKRNELLTSYGKMIPKYQISEARDKYRNSLSFYSNGNIKSIYLEERVYVNTSIGTINAEFLTFYEDGEIHRVFPRYGQLSGFWSEENEYETESEFHIKLAPCVIDHKITSFSFYQSGELAAVTILSSDQLGIDTPLGRLQGRYGVAFFPSGLLKSMEPAFPIRIKTTLGVATLYDTQAIGVHADKNSLGFDENGQLTSMAIIAETLHVKRDQKEVILSPRCVASQIDPEKLEILPLNIDLTPEHIIVRDATKQKHLFERDCNTFVLEPFQQYSCYLGSNCKTCHGCHHV